MTLSVNQCFPAVAVFSVPGPLDTHLNNNIMIIGHSSALFSCTKRSTIHKHTIEYISRPIHTRARTHLSLADITIFTRLKDNKNLSGGRFDFTVSRSPHIGSYLTKLGLLFSSWFICPLAYEIAAIRVFQKLN